MVNVGKKMCHVMRRSDLNGRITGNAAVDDHVANRRVFLKLAQTGSSYYQTKQVVLIVIPRLLVLDRQPGMKLL
ncbi:Hypothetical predicted protein [Mytilus galloprovincialis]|uniref:Uncharacterized protein n=2 Tax=Mytilus galloprovincialis TaxID=29158 RepID=A0A8B6G1Q0_MYTGA|nr:Hypothetical predicted protein [Mytilus galloprovincialis]